MIFVDVAGFALSLPAEERMGSTFSDVVEWPEWQARWKFLSVYHKEMEIMLKKLVLVAIAGVMLVSVGQVNADLTGYVNNPTGNSVDWTTAANNAGANINTDIDFDTHPTGALQSNFYSGVTMTSLEKVVFGAGPWNSNTNASQPGEGPHASSNYLDLDHWDGSSLTLTFDNPVSGVGLFTIDKFSGSSVATITAYDSSNTSLGSFSGTGINFQSNNLFFMGLMSDSQDIKKFVFDSNYGSGDEIGLDNIVYASSVVPVPGAAVLGMIGIGIVGAYTRKRRPVHVTEG